MELFLTSSHAVLTALYPSRFCTPAPARAGGAAASPRAGLRPPERLLPLCPSVGRSPGGDKAPRTLPSSDTPQKSPSRSPGLGAAPRSLRCHPHPGMPPGTGPFCHSLPQPQPQHQPGKDACTLKTNKNPNQASRNHYLSLKQL